MNNYQYSQVTGDTFCKLTEPEQYGPEFITDMGFADNSNVVLQDSAQYVMSDAPPIQFMNAINTGNKKLGNRSFMRLISGLHQQCKKIDIHNIAATGLQGTGQAMTHQDAIQRAFGHHNVTGMREHTGTRAGTSLDLLGSEGFSSNGRMAFNGVPDLYTQAHEAAHGVQQAASGNHLQLQGGIGEVGDKYEKHANAVAKAVVEGKSAEALLDHMVGTSTQVSAGPASNTAPVQMTLGSGAARRLTPLLRYGPLMSRTRIPAIHHRSTPSWALQAPSQTITPSGLPRIPVFTRSFFNYSGNQDSSDVQDWTGTENKSSKPFFIAEEHLLPVLPLYRRSSFDKNEAVMPDYLAKTAEEVKPYIVEWQNGKLVKFNDKTLLDTQDCYNHRDIWGYARKGIGLFVVDAYGTYYIGGEVNVTHHDYFTDAREDLAEKRVAFAGEIIVKGGKVVAISKKSGHYRKQDEKGSPAESEDWLDGKENYENFVNVIEHILKEQGGDLYVGELLEAPLYHGSEYVKQYRSGKPKEVLKPISHDEYDREIKVYLQVKQVGGMPI